MATCANASIVTINDQNSNSSIKNTKTKQVKNSKNISGGGCTDSTCTINSSQNGPVTIGSGGTLVIEEGGSITSDSSNFGVQINNNASTSATIDNKGTISGGNGINIGQNSSIDSIKNSGSITGTAWNGIDLQTGSSVGTIENTGTIIGGNQDGIQLKDNSKVDAIINKGYINKIGVSGTITHLDNQGKIEGIGSYGAITLSSSAKIETLTNSGTISGARGVFLWKGDIGTINNSGNIISTETDIGGAGIKLEGGGKIENITNTGTIKAENDGISVSYGSFGTLNIKDGGVIDARNYGIFVNQWQKLGDLYVDNASIYGGESGVFLGTGSTTSDISIKNGGMIYGGSYGMYFDHAYLNQNTTIAGENSAIHGGIAGIYLSRGSALKGTIEVKEKGMISGGENGFGIINADSANIGGSILISSGGVVTGILNKDNAKITGTIKVDGEGSSIVGGIINQDNGKIEGFIEVNNKGQIDSIINAGSGEISGSVKVDNHSKVENIINGALASSFYNNGVSTGKISGDVSVDNESIVGSIINAGQGEITGGIKVDNSSEVTNISNSGNGLISSDVSVDNGSKVGNIINDDYGKITGDVSIGKDSSVDKIINSGHGSIGGNIINNGNLGSINNSGSISGSIENNNGDLEIKNDGDLGGSITVGSGGGNTSISNGSNGNIGGGIVNNGNNDVNIDNQGTVKPDSNGNHITNNGNGNVNVGDWIVKPNEDGSFDGAINVGGNGSGSTNIDNITVDTSDPNFDASKPINPDNIVNNTGSGGNIGVGNVGSNNDLLNLVYDPITGQYKTLADVSAGVGSVMAQTIINTYMMRSFFLDTVLDDASRMAYKHARIHNNHKTNKNLVGFDADEHYHGFVLPYFSSNSIKLLGTNDYSKGNTKGVVAGFHTLKDIGMLGAYVGTEEANMDTKDYFSLKMQTVYAGLKYSNILLEDEIKEAFFKFHTKAAYTKNDVQKFVDKGKREANGNTDTYGYGASIGTGMNFYLDGADNIITPEVSLNYEGGFTKAFSMHGDGALNHERYYKSELNLFSSTASLKWLNKWHPQISTSFEAGARINFNPEVESRVNFANLKASETLDLPRTYQYASASLIFSLAEDLEMSFNYNGTFANNSHSHTGFLQFDFIF
ncbi:autotransporter outer membrane beta-barrel domain-containing protein [Campylobacter lari]|uniref:Autotransporter outer membrane beta-barrel domain-containing protein n=1 Tax=Campylobacter lari TaxID=201 RepID=A0A7U7W5R2_CAMLA|nr:autotransporter outer membrane beta-barrel domain-containing protein [Campylobacter lari]EAI3913491.1 autotransporter outer membrane beta-barrel domain-containing protein [Campylobacter lari]EAI4449453.1 autotransporter outer membrane beta-barrel domain-containing protein [Campylobacter lari]